MYRIKYSDLIGTIILSFISWISISVFRVLQTHGIYALWYMSVLDNYIRKCNCLIIFTIYYHNFVYIFRKLLKIMSNHWFFFENDLILTFLKRIELLITGNLWCSTWYKLSILSLHSFHTNRNVKSYHNQYHLIPPVLLYSMSLTLFFMFF